MNYSVAGWLWYQVRLSRLEGGARDAVMQLMRCAVMCCAGREQLWRRHGQLEGWHWLRLFAAGDDQLVAPGLDWRQ